MTITLRLVKGTELTYAELDGNFTDLDERLKAVEAGGVSVGPTSGYIPVKTNDGTPVEAVVPVMPVGEPPAEFLTASSLKTLNGESLVGVGDITSSTSDNVIVNGAMRVDQEFCGTSRTPATTPTYSADQWAFQATVGSKLTIGQNLGGITPPLGFSHYIGATVASAHVCTSNDFFMFQQPIEASATVDFNFGTPSAKQVFLSFYVRSSLVGLHSGALCNKPNGPDRNYPFTFTINTANEWEKKEIVIPGDVLGTWLNGMGVVGASLRFSMGAGDTYSKTEGAWIADNSVAATGAVRLVETGGASFYLTGVRLATTRGNFVHEHPVIELARCQRYYEKSYGVSTIPGSAITPGHEVDTNGGLYNLSSAIYASRATSLFNVPKRNAPTITVYSSNGTAGQVNFGSTQRTAAIITVSTRGFTVEASSGSSTNDARMSWSWVANSRM